MAGAKVKPSYEDFEPYCKWGIEAGQNTLEVHLHVDQQVEMAKICFKKEQLRVQLSSLGNMTITGERRVDESRWTRFRKEIKVPKECNNYEIRAKLSGGILYIVMPKKTTPPSSQDQVTPRGGNQENEQTKARINQDDVTKDTVNQELDTMLAIRPTNCTMQLQDGVSRLKMRKKMAINVAVAVVVMVILVAFVIYKHR
ncbi:unnamed protein product [Dovyalis caffra]|uniref:SHSP domain-containing protein n=1 Tax=Dovyalis caffra TaxID=77055 RepID=A0AAV1S0T3_9ROSI|nr:unnamed protein product [Dovyalis caffra]